MLDVNKKISKKEFVKKLGLTTVALSVLTPLVDAKTLFKGDSINLQDLNTQQIVATDTNKELVSLDTATYPSLTEISYVKGVTSGVQSQLGGKEPTLTAGTSAQYYRGDKSWQTLDKTAVGLGNVDNVQQIPMSEKGANNGVATLDSTGKIPTTQIPSTILTNTFVVASEAAMLALSATKGDIAVRTDIETTFILQGTDPTVLGDWVEFLFADPAMTGAMCFTVGNGREIVQSGLTFYMPQAIYTGTVLAWYISEISNPPLNCSAVFDVWKDTSGNYPPTVADSIAGTEKPTLTNQKLNKDESLTSFTTSFNQGDCFAIHVDSNDVGRKFLVVLKTLKS
jgi:hypothetical protein